MEDINYLLNDESNNDKLLIKELSIYIKNHRDNNNKINRNFIKNIVSIILNNSEIQIDEIIIDDTCNNVLGTCGSGILYLNMTNIINFSKDINRAYNLKIGDNRLLVYYELLFIIFHELTHARQEYLMNNNYNKMYNSSYELLQDNYDQYMENHDNILIERYANLRGVILSYKILSYIYSKKEINQLRKMIILYLYTGYKKDENGNIVAIIDYFNNIINENNLTKINDDFSEYKSFYNRLYLGLPITKKEFKNIINLYWKIEKDTCVDEEVKLLIKNIR